MADLDLIGLAIGKGSSDRQTTNNEHPLVQWMVNFSPEPPTIGASTVPAFEELEVLLGKNNICIAVKEKLVKDSGVASEAAYDNIILHLQTKPRAK
ncbi:unnamed protein product, partial [Nesidiocoris tenuis]